MVLIGIIASLTSIAVNVYTLWAVRKTLIGGMKNAAEVIKKI
jgi:Tfp pilus assembly major pilin PilA